MKHLSLIATVIPLIIIAIGLIGWVLTLRNDVTDSVKQLEGMQEEIAAVYERLDTDTSNIYEVINDNDVVVFERIETIKEAIVAIEEQLAIADNEMRTIMADHSGFNEVLQELGKAGLLPSGERREYGGYSYK